MIKRTYQTNQGWAYEIEINGKVKFRQECAPAISGNMIMSREQAEKISDIVIEKLKDNPSAFPTLNAETVTEIMK